MKPLIRAVLIHHKLPRRAGIRQQLRDLASHLDLQMSEIVDQPPIIVSHLTTSARAWVVSRQWLKSGADAFVQWLSGRECLLRALRRFAAEAARALAKLGSAPPEAWISAYRTCRVETILADKHLKAWQLALDAQADWLLVLEDDAQILPPTRDRLHHFLNQDLPSLERGAEVYCDLAGGFDPQVVLPRTADWNGMLERWTVPYIQTNTTCAYLASSSLLKRLLDRVYRYPILRQLPADHLINVASMFSRRSQPSCISLHWQAPFFLHGSFHAELGSSISGSR